MVIVIHFDYYTFNRNVNMNISSKRHFTSTVYCDHLRTGKEYPKVKCLKINRYKNHRKIQM